MKMHEWIAVGMLAVLAGWIFIANSVPGVYAAGQPSGTLANVQAAQLQASDAPAIASNAQGGAGESVTIPIKVVNGLYDPREIRVKEGTKVRIELDRNSFLGCMTSFNIWGLGISASARQNNIVEFVADKPGTYKTSCPMGMGDGKFIVEAASGNEAAAQQNTAQAAAATPKGGSCGGSGGGCGCGG